MNDILTWLAVIIIIIGLLVIAFVVLLLVYWAVVAFFEALAWLIRKILDIRC